MIAYQQINFILSDKHITLYTYFIIQYVIPDNVDNCGRIGTCHWGLVFFSEWYYK